MPKFVLADVTIYNCCLYSSGKYKNSALSIKYAYVRCPLPFKNSTQNGLF